MHGGKHCARCTQFYYAGGEVHPIRDSPGYDPSIEKDTREERERHAQHERYRGIHRERGSSVVERPPWAAGLTERHLISIARAHGTNAGTPLWWEKAGLTGSVKADPRLNQRAEKVSGELRYALEGRTIDRRGTAAGARSIERRVILPRVHARADRRRGAATDPADRDATLDAARLHARLPAHHRAGARAPRSTPTVHD
jgi:hypothetical protein